jgi:hypothetical protein
MGACTIPVSVTVRCWEIRFLSRLGQATVSETEPQEAMKAVDGIVLPVASCDTLLSGDSEEESFTKPLLCQLSYAGH